MTTLLCACATKESFHTLEPQKVDTYHAPYSGPKSSIAIGNFDNKSNYLQGIFSSGSSQLGNQAKTILKSHLQSTNRFVVLDRENLDGLKQEANLRGQTQKLLGARYVIGGAVTEFGRKETGDKQLFGIAGSGKTQTAYSKITLTVIDVVSSAVIYSTQGAGEYSLSNREIIGFGSQAGYDATLNGKVLNLAITEAVNHLVHDLQNGVWSIQE
ncbi:MAG: CsgG/HfaB family protein [Gammaproteobacteria bacterium]